MSLFPGMSWFPLAAGLSAAVRLVLFGLLLYTGPAFSAVSVTVFSGETATLPCSAPYKDISKGTVEWTKPGLEDSYVLLFRDGRLDSTLQESSFKDRVALADPELKNGNLSMILKNVKKNDEGLYECHFIGDGARKRRAISGNKPIQTIDLKVREQPGDEKEEEGSNERGKPWIITGIMCCAAVVAVAVGVGVGFFVRRNSRRSEQTVIDENQDVDLEQAPLSESGSRSG